MRNSMKVAKWEYKRNITNKSFLISLALTPLLFILFATLPTLLAGMDSEDDPVTVYIEDEVGVTSQIEQLNQRNEMNWNIEGAPSDEEAMMERLEGTENTAYIPVTESALQEGDIPVYTSKGMSDGFSQEIRMLQQPLQSMKLQQLDLTEQEMDVITNGVTLNSVSVEDTGGAPEQQSEGNQQVAEDPMEGVVPGAFAGIILFSILMTGMMIFQSASQEKKEKVAEIVLSSLTPGELMQGKIIGYFGLGLTQVFVWAAVALPIAVWRLDDIPVIEYLFVPELLLLILIAVAGYLLFAAMFVGFGATVEDVNSSSNFQGLVLMLPFLPFIFIGPILADPNGIAAVVGSYIPVTAPGVLLIRLSLLETWPWTEIVVSLGILLVSVWLFMKLAGKIFKVGILMYGKNATPAEIWKWLRA
ncbi:ABC transporter permease [Thalassobacillus sp. CUG 92003]|uniref:ABC transporter permease n=1 Tax=Thalassobacillus sp. CUG 92003 TaxID=2736641 RepID=UPI0015E7BA4C|nr:ABC transporter permease [Thalassobacillus sp. CUG 92003]